MFTASLDELPRSNHPPSVFLQTGGSDPPRGVLWVRFNEGVEEHSGPLDIADLCFGLDGHAVKGCKVALGIYGCCYSGGDARHLIQFERQNLIASLSDFHKVGQSSRIRRSLESPRSL